MICTENTTCVLCDSDKLEPAFNLRPSALAEDYKVVKAHPPDALYPLELVLCKNCCCLQLRHSIDHEHLFSNYSYETKSSPGLVKHFADYAKQTYRDDSFIIDIGSNDGTLLHEYQKLGANKVLGVEPSFNLCNESVRIGVPCEQAFFSHTFAEHILKQYGAASLITANNVFAHSRNLSDMVDGVGHLLTDDGRFIIEVSYLPLLIQNMVFDFIYHEHLVYHSLLPLQKFFNRHELKIVKVETHAMKGGSARFTVVKQINPIDADASVENFTDVETQMRLQDVATYKKFETKIDQIKYQVSELFHKITNKNQTIAAYGASATTTTLLHHFQIGGFISYLYDDNIKRAGMYSSGFQIPVCSPEKLDTDYILITAWRFAQQIIEKHKDYKGTWIIPLPQLRII